MSATRRTIAYAQRPNAPSAFTAATHRWAAAAFTPPRARDPTRLRGASGSGYAWRAWCRWGRGTRSRKNSFWSAYVLSQTVLAGEVVHRHWREAPRRRSPLGSEGWLLRYGPEHATWVVEAPAASAVAAETEWLSLTDLAWAVVPAGEPVAPLPGPCLYRLRHREETP